MNKIFTKLTILVYLITAALSMQTALANNAVIVPSASFRADTLHADSLVSLTVTDVVLSPVFATNITDYTAVVNNSISHVKVLPVASDSTAIVTLNGAVVAWKDSSSNISLIVGENIITTTVTNADSSATVSYTVKITRAASTDATLTGITLSSGTLSPEF